MKHPTAILCIFAYASILCCCAKQLPSFIKRCKMTTADDMEVCLKERIKDLWPRLLEGIPELKVIPMEPLEVDRFTIHTGNGRSVFLDANLTHLVAYDVKDLQLLTFNLDLEKLTFTLHAKLPKLRVEGAYTGWGKALLFEIRSAGKAEVNLTDIDAYCQSRVTIVPKNGKEYVRIETDEEDYKTDYKYDKISLYLDNLIETNPQLTKEINKAINDNIYELAPEVNPLIFNSVHLLIINLIKPVFDSFSLDELFES